MNLLYGRQTVREFLKSSARESSPQIIKIVVAQSIPADLLGPLRGLGASMHELPRKEIDRMFPGIHHQGVVIQLAAPIRVQKSSDWKTALLDPGPHLGLIDVEDPQNLGAILRTAETLGVSHVFITPKGAQMTPAVHRSSSGASLHISVFSVPSSAALIEEAKKQNVWIASAVAESSEVESGQLLLTTPEFDQLPENDKLLLLMGSEGTGLNQSVVRKSDYLITIPMHGATMSFNVSVATGILLERIINR